MTDQKQKIRLVSPADLDVSYFCGSGAGGQARNKVASGVQIIHRASGAIGRASDSRSQADNKQAAFLRLTKTPKFKVWLNKKLMEIELGETLEKQIEKETTPDKLKHEIKINGKWIEVDSKYFDTLEAKTEI